MKEKSGMTPNERIIEGLCRQIDEECAFYMLRILTRARKEGYLIDDVLEALVNTHPQLAEFEVLKS